MNSKYMSKLKNLQYFKINIHLLFSLEPYHRHIVLKKI